MLLEPALSTGHGFNNFLSSSCLPTFTTFLAYVSQNFEHSKDDRFHKKCKHEHEHHKSHKHKHKEDEHHKSHKHKHKEDEHHKSHKHEHKKDEHHKKYDFIIVGAGTAGCVVANRLSEKHNWKVLLLEGGGEQPLATEVPGLLALLPNTSIDYNYNIEMPGDECQRRPTYCTTSRGNMMGGTSSMNGMGFIRGSKHDFNGWANSGNSGWHWDDVLPYFKKSENLLDKIPCSKSSHHSTGGYLSISLGEHDENYKPIFDSWKELGYEEVDYNSGNQIGIGKLQYSIRKGVGQSSNIAFIRPIRGKRSNLKVSIKSRVTKIILDKHSKKATGVEYVVKGHKKQAFASKEVIISAGAIESPKLLMLSGIGPADELREANIEHILEAPVGRNLHDHAAISLFSIVPTNRKDTYKEIDDKKKELHKWKEGHKSTFGSSGVWGIVNFLKSSSKNSTDESEVMVHYLKTVNEKDENNSDSVISGTSYYNELKVTATLLAPKSRGWLKLNKNNPISGNIILNSNLFSDSQDFEIYMKNMIEIKKITETEAFKKSGFKVVSNVPLCDKLLENQREYYECVTKNYAAPFFHTVGTCKMGPRSDSNAVVDSTLKVHGIKCLRVIDGSIMPTITRGNTYAPIVMIGEKGSDMIKKDWE